MSSTQRIRSADLLVQIWHAAFQTECVFRESISPWLTALNSEPVLPTCSKETSVEKTFVLYLFCLLIIMRIVSFSKLASWKIIKMLRRHQTKSGLLSFVINSLRSFIVSNSAFYVLLPICIGHSDVFISKDRVVRCTFKLTVRDCDIYIFSLRYFWWLFSPGHISYHPISFFFFPSSYLLMPNLKRNSLLFQI